MGRGLSNLIFVSNLFHNSCTALFCNKECVDKVVSSFVAAEKSKSGINAAVLNQCTTTHVLTAPKNWEDVDVWYAILAHSDRLVFKMTTKRSTVWDMDTMKRSIFADCSLCSQEWMTSTLTEILTHVISKHGDVNDIDMPVLNYLSLRGAKCFYTLMNDA